MALIRPWKQRDLDYVAESVRREGWGHLRRDVERCWRFEPNGCFIAEVDGRRVGHVFSVSYGEVGWVGLLIVDPEERGRGVGAVLMRVAMDYLRGRGVETIRLEAVDKAVPLYRRLGFKDEFDSLRLFRRLEPGFRSHGVESLERGGSVQISEMKEADLERVAGFDSGHFGADRSRVLRGLFVDGLEGGCLVAEGDGGSVLGYAMSRVVQDAFLFGPWVCANSDVAERLYYALVDAVSHRGEREITVRVGVPAPNRAGVGLLQRLGFSLVTKSVRMVWGKLDHVGDVLRIYGIGGAEKG